MENRGLLFIPDISGFSKFVSETEINHSRMIIQELLEVLINANTLDLQISEIEGDAILFYKFGDAPAVEALYAQVEKMFCEFHQNIQAYDQQKFCQCTACKSAIGLTLKIITHYGEFTSYNVRNFQKLIGKDLIVAHQLLKNEIQQHEYWLITKTLSGDRPEGTEPWMQWVHGAKQTENGEISFYYAQLGALRNKVEPFEPLRNVLDNKVKMISVQQEYDTDIITLLHATGDFQYRHKWREGVQMVEEIGHFLPRVGRKCRCILQNGETSLYSSSYHYEDDRVEFSETDEKDHETTYYTLERTGYKKTRLTLDYYVNKGLPGQIMFSLMRKAKMEDNFRRSLERLVDVVRELKIPTAADR